MSLVNEEIELASAGVCGVSWPSPGSSRSALWVWTLLPSPPPPSSLPCLTEGSSHIGRAQVGIWVSGHTFQFQGSLITFTTALGPTTNFRIQGYLRLAAECFWGVSCSQQSNSKGTRSPHSRQSSLLYGGGSEPAETHISVSYCLRIFSGFRRIIRAQFPRITARGRVVSKTCLKENYQILPTQKSLEYSHAYELGSSFWLSTPFWSREQLLRTAQRLVGE